MTETLTGPMAEPIDLLRTMVAASASFQAWVGHPGDAELAKARIYLCVERAPTRPAALIADGDAWAARRGAAGQGEYLYAGNLVLSFAWDIPLPLEGAEAMTDREAELVFISAVGGILQEVLALGDGPEYLPIREIRATGPATLFRPEKEQSAGRVYAREFRVEWGL